MEIYKKLLKIQTEVSGLGKDKAAFGYDYVTGTKILSFIKPIMDREGIILKQEILSIDNERQDYFTGKPDDRKEKNEILTKVMMKFTWVDTETGEKDENLFGANGQNGWDKGVGSALTYAERYFLLKYFHIATDEDDIDQPKVLQPFTPNLKMWNQAIEAGKTIDEMKKRYSFTKENEDSYIIELISSNSNFDHGMTKEDLT